MNEIIFTFTGADIEPINYNDNIQFLSSDRRFIAIRFKYTGGNKTNISPISVTINEDDEWVAI